MKIDPSEKEGKSRMNRILGIMNIFSITRLSDDNILILHTQTHASAYRNAILLRSRFYSGFDDSHSYIRMLISPSDWLRGDRK
jgi:hypothetical protein